MQMSDCYAYVVVCMVCDATAAKLHHTSIAAALKKSLLSDWVCLVRLTT